MSNDKDNKDDKFPELFGKGMKLRLRDKHDLDIVMSMLVPLILAPKKMDKYYVMDFEGPEYMCIKYSVLPNKPQKDVSNNKNMQ